MAIVNEMCSINKLDLLKVQMQKYYHVLSATDARKDTPTPVSVSLGEVRCAPRRSSPRPMG